jgi:hypothetical protein
VNAPGSVGHPLVPALHHLAHRSTPSIGGSHMIVAVVGKLIFGFLLALVVLGILIGFAVAKKK